MRKLLLVLAIAVLCGPVVRAEVIFQRSDPGKDDYGAGALTYPSHDVYEPGLFDLRHFQVAVEENHVHFDFRFAAVSNPFRAPEGFFHQRLEVYIATGENGGKEIITLGEYQFRTVPGWGWHIRLAVVPFGESKLYISRDGQAQVYLTGIKSELLLDGETIRVQVDKNLLPEPVKTWRYYVLVGAFDGLAADFWRDVGDGPWQIGGDGPPVFDLLAARWGWKNQKRQLTSGILYPAQAGGNIGLYLRLAILLCGVIVIAIFFRRWIRVGT